MWLKRICDSAYSVLPVLVSIAPFSLIQINLLISARKTGIPFFTFTFSVRDLGEGLFSCPANLQSSYADSPHLGVDWRNDNSFW